MAKVTKICEQCGKEYKIRQGIAKQSKYCLRRCKDLSQQIDLGKKELYKLRVIEAWTLEKLAKKYNVAMCCVVGNLKRYGFDKLRQYGGKNKNYDEKKQLHKRGLWRCWRCEKIKKKSEFGSQKRKCNWVGHAGACKECQKRLVQKSRKQRPWRERANALNLRAGFKFITEQELKGIWELQKGKCYYCGKDLKKMLGTKEVHTEHVVPDLQEADNIVISCKGCNAMKGDATAEKLESYANQIREGATKSKLAPKEYENIAQKIREHCAKIA